MNENEALSAEALERLFDQIRRYLDAVETFRREGCEPRWSDAPVPKEVLQ